MEKIYQQPVFEVVRQEESNKVFFTASGENVVGGFFASLGIKTGEWI